MEPEPADIDHPPIHSHQFCPTTGLPVLTCGQYTRQTFDSENTAGVCVIGNAIVYNALSGAMDQNDVVSGAALMSEAQHNIKTSDGRFIVIQDLHGLTKASPRALKVFNDALLRNQRLAALILCNVSPWTKVGIKMVQRSNPRGVSVKICESYSDAVHLSLHICSSIGLESGSLVFDPIPALREDCRWLVPAEIQQRETWCVEGKDYWNQSVLIDRSIMYSQSIGYLEPEAIASIQQLRLDVRSATVNGSHLDYIVLDARRLKGGSRKARKQYAQNLLQWNESYPLRMFIAVGANTFMRTAIVMARPFLPFRVATVADVNEAFALVARDRAGSAPQGPPGTTPQAIHQKVDRQETEAILGYIGAIDWEKKGIDVDPPFEKQHSLYPIIQAIRLIKTELDDLLEERETAERARRESEQKYRELFEEGSDWLCIHDLEGNFIETNFAFKDEVDWNRLKSSRPNLKDIIPERYHPELDQYYQRIRKNTYDKGILNILGADDRERVLKYNNVLIKNHDGDPVWVKSSARDITSEIKASAEKERLQKKLQQSQKMESIGTLAGGIAHDFNNILSSVIGFTELAIEDAGDNLDLQDNLQEVLKAGHRAKELVHQILTFARQSDEKRKPIQVSLIAKEVIKMMRSTFPANIDIKQRILSDARILGNPTQVQQILMNLCTNAAQAMGDHGGFLDIRLEDMVIEAASESSYRDLKSGIYLKITVSDTGPGIDPHIIDSIFEPYFSTKEQDQGTGMGLAIVHGIVKGYDGEVYVDSHLGSGSVFTVLIPTAPESHDSDQPIAEAQRHGDERILIVDDEGAILKMGCRSLNHLGYSVTAISSSLEALAQFESDPNRFQMVITDMTMPGLTGDQLALKMLKIRPDLPIIMCTGFNKNISKRRAKNIGVSALLYKPVGKRQLAETVRNVLDRQAISAKTFSPS